MLSSTVFHGSSPTLEHVTNPSITLGAAEHLERPGARRVDARDQLLVIARPAQASIFWRSISSNSSRISACWMATSSIGLAPWEREVDREVPEDDSLAAHHQHTARQEDGLQHVMGHEQDGRARIKPEALELGAQVARRDGVEVAERLVHQQEVGLDRQSPRDPHALLHPARELSRVHLGLGTQIHQVEEPPAACGALLGRSLVEDVDHVVEHGLPGEQPGILEHVPDPGITLAAAEHLEGPGARRVDPGDHVQERALSAAGRPDERHERVAFCFEAHVAEREHGILDRPRRREHLLHISRYQSCHVGSPSPAAQPGERSARPLLPTDPPARK